MKIIFSGGGTLGPVTPLLAIHAVIHKRYPDTQAVWIGTRTGPEKTVVETAGIAFRTIAYGKFRRYTSIFNLVDLFCLLVGFVQSLKLIAQENPDVCISAGGYISVPLHIAAWLFGIPTWIHQQDVHVGLANRLMAPFARATTLSLELHLNQFKKMTSRRALIRWLGNPVRMDILSGNQEAGYAQFNLDKNLPVIFVIGGGTGSVRINQLTTEAIPHLKGLCNIIHLTGLDRPQTVSKQLSALFPFYHPYQFFNTEMANAYAVSDLIVARAGFGTIAELAALKKPAILIPKPGHQEQNAKFLADQGAALMVDERTANGHYLAGLIRELCNNRTHAGRLGQSLGQLLPMAKSEAILSLVTEIIRP